MKTSLIFLMMLCIFSCGSSMADKQWREEYSKGLEIKARVSSAPPAAEGDINNIIAAIKSRLRLIGINENDSIVKAGGENTIIIQLPLFQDEPLQKVGAILDSREVSVKIIDEIRSDGIFHYKDDIIFLDPDGGDAAVPKIKDGDFFQFYPFSDFNSLKKYEKYDASFLSYYSAQEMGSPDPDRQKRIDLQYSGYALPEGLEYVRVRKFPDNGRGGDADGSRYLDVFLYLVAEKQPVIAPADIASAAIRVGDGSSGRSKMIFVSLFLTDAGLNKILDLYSKRRSPDVIYAVALGQDVVYYKTAGLFHPNLLFDDALRAADDGLRKSILDDIKKRYSITMEISYSAMNNDFFTELVGKMNNRYSREIEITDVHHLKREDWLGRK
ncbi:MAG: hypothetical protein JXD23_10955 [Spirochaetales bacterium]|nr:hypothetical protein [Spirochaetales bacterium]